MKMLKSLCENSIDFRRGRNHRRFLHSTTAISANILQQLVFGIGIVLASGLYAFAGPDADPIKIPLHHLKDHQRLGILVGVNGGAAHMYMFDTGSDQFNGQFYPKDALQNAGKKTVYAYGDGTYAYRLQPVAIDRLTYYGEKGAVAYDDQGAQFGAQFAGRLENAHSSEIWCWRYNYSSLGAF